MSSSPPGAGHAKSGPELPSARGPSFQASSPIAQEALARDLAECSDTESLDEDVVVDGSSSDGEGPTLYRRPSGIAYGGTFRPSMSPNRPEEPVLTRVEKKQSRDAERSLLRDNHLIPPKQTVVERPGFFWALYNRLFGTEVPTTGPDEEAPQENGGASVTSPLLGPQAAPDGGGVEPHHHLSEEWDAAVAAGQLRTTWQREAKTITAYSVPLIVTFLLQYSIHVASIFAVGKIGKEELGAVSRRLPHLSRSSFGLSRGPGLANHALLQLPP